MAVRAPRPEASPPSGARASVRRRAASPNAGDLRAVNFGCATLADAEPQALGITYWFDAAHDGEPYTVTVHFAGRRSGTKRKPGPSDSFTATESVEHVLPGSGRIAITTRILDIAPGEWQVTANAVADTQPKAGTGGSAAPRKVKLPRATASVTTAYAPVIRIRAPGARLGAWPALVSVGAAVALGLQALLANRAHLNGLHVTLVSLLASLIGLVGAKFYYLVEHRGRTRGLLVAGMCIQGFILAAIGTVVIGALAVGLPVGRLLDLTVPGLLFGMVIGRFGCFFAGCCAGRPTASRWGLWSSDRRLGTRRIPTQLFESALALLVGLIALFAVWTATPEPAGIVFTGAIAAYTLGRQLLFPLRDLPRKTTRGRSLVMTLAAVVLAVDLAVATLA